MKISKVTKLKRGRMTVTLVFLLLVVNSGAGQTLSFAPPVDISGNSVQGVSALDVADFNQDGLKDVAVLEGGAHAEGGATFAWFEQTPGKTWIRHEFGGLDLFDDFIGSARCGDMDGDGDMDLVLSNDGHTTGPLKVFFFENPGKTEVKENWPHHLMATIDGFHANDMRLADMDGDGDLDLVGEDKYAKDARPWFYENLLK